MLACTHDRGLVKMDCSLMKKLLAKAGSPLIDFDQTKRDLLDQLHLHTSERTVSQVA